MQPHSAVWTMWKTRRESLGGVTELTCVPFVSLHTPCVSPLCPLCVPAHALCVPIVSPVCPHCVPVHHVHLLCRHHRHHPVLQLLPAELLDAFCSGHRGGPAPACPAVQHPLQVRYGYYTPPMKQPGKMFYWDVQIRLDRDFPPMSLKQYVSLIDGLI